MIFKNRNKGNWDGIEKAATMGTNFVAHTVVGLAMGYYCDKWFHTEPWGLLFWLIMGIVAGFRHMYRDAMKMSRTQSMDATTGSAAPDGTQPDAAQAAAKAVVATETPEAPKAAPDSRSAHDDAQGGKQGGGGSGNA